MQAAEAYNENEGRVAGMHQSTSSVRITASSLEEHGTVEAGACHIGEKPHLATYAMCNLRPKFLQVVWCPGYSTPPTFDRYVIVDDDGDLLATGI